MSPSGQEPCHGRDHLGFSFAQWLLIDLPGSEEMATERLQGRTGSLWWEEPLFRWQEGLVQFLVAPAASAAWLALPPASPQSSQKRLAVPDRPASLPAPHLCSGPPAVGGTIPSLFVWIYLTSSLLGHFPTPLSTPQPQRRREPSSGVSPNILRARGTARLTLRSPCRDEAGFSEAGTQS